MDYKVAIVKLQEFYKKTYGESYHKLVRVDSEDSRMFKVKVRNGEYWQTIAEVSKLYQYSYEMYGIVSDRYKTIYPKTDEILWELAATPIAKRDLKCFMIKVLQCEDEEEDRYIAFDKNSNSFELVSPAFVTNEVQTVFTISEIDYMKRAGELKVDWDSVLEEV